MMGTHGFVGHLFFLPHPPFSNPPLSSVNAETYSGLSPDLGSKLTRVADLHKLYHRRVCLCNVVVMCLVYE